MEDTTVVHAEAGSTIIQRETDMQFLKRLAGRNGFECCVEGGTGRFGPPRLGDPPQPVLAVHFGDETNVEQISFEIDALKPASVSMCRLDGNTKEIVAAAVNTGSFPLLGGLTARPSPHRLIDPARVVIGRGPRLQAVRRWRHYAGPLR